MQRVQIVRVPNYNNVAVDGTLTTQPWYMETTYYASDPNLGKSESGIIAFRVAGTLSGGGMILADGKGYPSTTSYVGNTTVPDYGHGVTDLFGGGGAYGANGERANPTGRGGLGGIAYGDAQLNQIFFGGGGGHVLYNKDGVSSSWPGGRGGGIVWISAHTITMDAASNITAKGSMPVYPSYTPPQHYAGTGAGGAIRIQAETIGNIPNASADGVETSAGAAGSGEGRIAVYYENDFDSSG
jgi:hypothetical protein